MEVRDRPFAGQHIVLSLMRVLRPAGAEMERAEHLVRLLAAGLQHVDLTGRRPAPVLFILGQHP